MNIFNDSDIDLNKLYEEAKDNLCIKNDGYRLNFGVYYTPNFLWAA